MANVMMTVQPAMKKTMTTMKPYKYVTDDNDGDDHDYDYGDEDYYDYDDTDNELNSLGLSAYLQVQC